MPLSGIHRAVNANDGSPSTTTPLVDMPSSEVVKGAYGRGDDGRRP